MLGMLEIALSIIALPFVINDVTVGIERLSAVQNGLEANSVVNPMVDGLFKENYEQYERFKLLLKNIEFLVGVLSIGVGIIDVAKARRMATFADTVDDFGMVKTAKAGENAVDVVGDEIFYRTMSKEHYDYLQLTGELPSTGETFISPALSFAKDYDGITVKFTLKKGTTDKLLSIGQGNNSIQAIDDYGRLPKIETGWSENNVYFKGEGNQTNIGLGRGKGLEIFNRNILEYVKVSQQ